MLRQNIEVVRRLNNIPWSLRDIPTRVRTAYHRWAVSAARFAKNPAPSPCWYISTAVCQKPVSSRLSTAFSLAYRDALKKRTSFPRNLNSSTKKNELAWCSSGVKDERRRATEEDWRGSRSSFRNASGSLLLLLNAAEIARLPRYRLDSYQTGRLWSTK